MPVPEITAREFIATRETIATAIKGAHSGLQWPSYVKIAEALMEQDIVDIERMRPPRSGPARQVLAVQVNTYASVVVEVEAVQWDGTAEHATYVIDWVLAGGGTARYIGVGEEHHLRYTDEGGQTSGDPIDGNAPAFIVIHTLEGDHRQNAIDWTIRGTEGEHYPCKPSVFARKYRAVAS